MEKIWEWLCASNRLAHLGLGVLVGLLPTDWYNTEVLACGVAGAMEFKDWQWRACGGKPDPIDFIMTVIGVNIGHLLRIGFIATL
jgi:hypothetical protein